MTFFFINASDLKRLWEPGVEIEKKCGFSMLIYTVSSIIVFSSIIQVAESTKKEFERE